MQSLLKRLLWLFVAMRSSNASQKAFRFEIERKYRLTLTEYKTLQGLLVERGFTRGHTFSLTDTFLPVPNKGELIRVRDQASDSLRTSILTLKNWEMVAGQKERRESEVDPLDSLSRSILLWLGRRASGSSLLSYTKQRQELTDNRDGLQVTAALDYVDELGEFSGYYLEFEVIALDNKDVEKARATIAKLVAEFLGSAERPTAPSYRDMLEQSRSGTNSH